MLLLAGCGDLPTPRGEARPAPGDGRTGRVVKVVDGDTIHVLLGSRREKVRYIGVDTPEPVSRECFAGEASRANARLVAGRRVRLVLDEDPRDRYGRLLAYVFRAGDDRFVNADLVRRGLAQALPVGPNERHAARFARLERDARRAGLGMWGTCAR